MLSLGVIYIAFVSYIAHRMDVVDHESQPVHLTLKLPDYYTWLGNKSISPVFATITASQKTEIGKVIYANSITLTPGTVTVNLEGDRVII